MIYKGTGADRPDLNGSLVIGEMDFIKKINPI
jgi:hypothetical protein